MEFQATALPDERLFRDAFNAGWEKYLQVINTDAVTAAQEYMRGPVAMAKLILEHGGDCHQVAAAAALAGPALFTKFPSQWLDQRLTKFSSDILEANNCPDDMLGSVIPRLSSSARLFFQATSILMLEQLARGHEDSVGHSAYTEALDIYSIARGSYDVYRLDGRFEIAAMKVTSVLENPSHFWALLPHKKAPLVHA